MKISFKILAIILVLSVNAKAELISLSECYMADFKSSDGKNEEVYKSYTDWKDKGGKVNGVTYTLNTNSQTITKGYINSDEEIDKYFKTYKIILPKIEKTIFKIENIGGNFITARPTKLKDIKSDKTLEFKIDFDLANARVYSYTIKDSSNSEIKRKTLKKIFAPAPPSKDVSKAKKMTKEEFLTSVTLNLSKNNLNNPTEISKNLSKWEDIFDEINTDNAYRIIQSERKIKSEANKKLMKDLDIDKFLARLLTRTGLATVSDIKDRSAQVLANIDGIDKILAETLISRAKEFYKENLTTTSYTEQCDKTK